MEIAYKFTPKELNKFLKFKNPTTILDKNEIIKMENTRYI